MQQSPEAEMKKGSHPGTKMQQTANIGTRGMKRKREAVEDRQGEGEPWTDMRMWGRGTC